MKKTRRKTATQKEYVKQWTRYLRVRRFATVGRHTLAYVLLNMNDGAYDGESKLIAEGWILEGEESNYELFDRLEDLLAGLDPDVLRAAVLSTPEAFMEAIVLANHLGRLIHRGGIAESVLLSFGQAEHLRYPEFDGKTFRFQVLRTPPLNMRLDSVRPRDRTWRLVPVTASMTGRRVTTKRPLRVSDKRAK